MPRLTVAARVFRTALFISLSVAAPARRAAAEEGTAPAATVPPAAAELAAEALLSSGDRARTERRMADAQKAYLAALAIEPTNATVRGRLGVIAARAGDHVHAVTYLDDAVRHNGGRTPEEREEFALALAHARDEVSLVRVNINVGGAAVSIDGDPTPNVNGRTSFWLYIGPGRHEMHVTAEGHEEQRQTFSAPKGGEVSLGFQLRPLAEREQAAPEPSRVPDPAPAVRPAKHVVPSLSRPKWQFVVNIGPAVAWGAAPGFAVGVVGGVGVRWPAGGFDVSVGGELRAVRGLGTLERLPDLKLWGLALAVPACLHGRRLFACVLVQGEALLPSHTAPAVGGGPRVGVELPLAAVKLRFWGDGVVRPWPLTVDLYGERVWPGSPFGVTGGAAVVW